MQLTAEQQAVISTNQNLVINAVAGSGKTTTLIEYARTRPSHSKILYLAFNKTVKTEAIEKFSMAGVDNVKVETAHSLAYEHVVKFSKYKLVQGYKSYEWCEMLNISTGDIHTNYVTANHVSRFISYFCNSKASKVQDLNYADVVNDEKAKSFVNNFYKQIESYTRLALAKMDKGEISITHDFYLKKFQLRNPVLNYDYILFDEGQDASPAMLDIFLKQNAIKIIVGDRHQQIYGWRYAINSLEQVDFPVYDLSHSFRFDDEIAMIANKILLWKTHLGEPPSIKLIGAATHEPGVRSRATLGRTNVSLLINAISQTQHNGISKVYFEGNINSYTFADEGASLYDVLNLYLRKPHKIKDKLIASMPGMKELEDYIEKTEDTSLSIIVDVVKEFGDQLPTLIQDLKTKHVDSKDEAEMIFSTVHRCKGMEYDEVILLTDFINEEKLQRLIAQCGGDKISSLDKNRLLEEVNVLYVATTRAKKLLSIPPEINPLRSIQQAKNVPKPLRSHYKSSYESDWDLYSKKAFPSSNYKSNVGKRWTEEDKDLLVSLFNKKIGMKEIASELSRGENAIKYKLIEMRLIDEDDLF